MSGLPVRVFYPMQSGRMVLRADGDWDKDIPPDHVDAAASTFDFTIPGDRPYAYFKPCILDGGNVHWSVGSNYRVVRGCLELQEVYPMFYSPQAGKISDVLTLPDAAFPNAHRVRIYHPPGYFENTLRRYPVLYMHDGPNLFDAGEAFLGRDWDVEDIMNTMDAMNLINKAIVVGVYPKDRETEYVLPGYEAYGRYLVEGLKPAVDAQLRTLTGPQDTAVMGSSLGGVVSLYLAWQWPQVFGKAACLSSTFTYKDDLMQRIADEKRRDITIYLDSGWPEDNYEVTIMMRNVLLKRGYRFGQDFLYFAYPRAAHDETFWSMRAHIPFQFFFVRRPPFAPA